MGVKTTPTFWGQFFEKNLFQTLIVSYMRTHNICFCYCYVTAWHAIKVLKRYYSKMACVLLKYNKSTFSVQIPAICKIQEYNPNKVSLKKGGCSVLLLLLCFNLIRNKTLLYHSFFITKT